MRVLFDSYNCVQKNPSGGVQKRIRNISYYLGVAGITVEFFDKWKTIEDVDCYHLFKVTHESYDVVAYMKQKQIPVVVSSVLPIEHGILSTLKFGYSFIGHSAAYYNKKILDIADAVIAQTDIEKKYITKNYKIKADKIVVIPNGVSDIYGESDDGLLFRSKFDINNSYLLQVGAIEPNKNQLSTIKAINGTGLSLIIVGGENKTYHDYYEQCRKAADENVIFTGWITDESLLASAYSGAKSVILPSYHEIFGNSLFEGARSGANIISTNVLPIKSWGLDKWCLTVNPNSIDDMKNKIIQSMSKEKTSELALYIKNNYSWSAVTNDYLSIYKTVINTKKE